MSGARGNKKESRDCNLYSRRISPYKFQHGIKNREDDTKTYYYKAEEERKAEKTLNIAQKNKVRENFQP